MGEMVQFRSDGSMTSGYLAIPRSGSGPGVVVIQEWWGLVPHIKDVADRFAAFGFVALAPDLFDGRATTEPDEAAKLMMSMELERSARHMSGAVDYLVDHAATTADRIGAVGFCMGGGLVLWLSTLKPEITACVPFYGAIPWDSMQPDYARSNAAYLGHYAEHDSWATQDGAHQLEDHLVELGKVANFYFYPDTEHAFFNDDRPEIFNKAAAKLAWQRTIDFFRDRL